MFLCNQRLWEIRLVVVVLVVVKCIYEAYEYVFNDLVATLSVEIRLNCFKF